VTVVVLALLLGAVFAKTELLDYLSASVLHAARAYGSLFAMLKG
jgi:hypothetical protein